MHRGRRGGTAPAISLPGGTPPADLTTKILRKGDRPRPCRGSSVVVQYDGEVWGNGDLSDSSWAEAAQRLPDRRRPPSSRAGTGPGRQTVGSRVMLVVPPASATGRPAPAHSRDPETLVFVVDVLAAYGPAHG